MWPNDVGTFNRHLASVYVYKKFVWVLGGFIGVLKKIYFKKSKKIEKKNHDLRDTPLHYKTKNEN